MENNIKFSSGFLLALLLCCASLAHAQVRITAIDEALSTMTETPRATRCLKAATYWLRLQAGKASSLA